MQIDLQFVLRVFRMLGSQDRTRLNVNGTRCVCNVLCEEADNAVRLRGDMCSFAAMVVVERWRKKSGALARYHGENEARATSDCGTL